MGHLRFELVIYRQFSAFIQILEPELPLQPKGERARYTTIIVDSELHLAVIKVRSIKDDALDTRQTLLSGEQKWSSQLSPSSTEN